MLLLRCTNCVDFYVFLGLNFCLRNFFCGLFVFLLLCLSSFWVLSDLGGRDSETISDGR